MAASPVSAKSCESAGTTGRMGPEVWENSEREKERNNGTMIAGTRIVFSILLVCGIINLEKTSHGGTKTPSSVP